MNDSTQPITQAQQVPLPEMPFWRVPWEFAVHALVGTWTFAIIAAAAVLLELAVHKLETLGIGRVIIFGLKAGEYSLYGADLLLFGVFLWRTTKRTFKRL